MKEGRAAKYGRFYAGLVNYVVRTFPEEDRDGYKSGLIQEVELFSFEPRRQGELLNKGCTWELEGIDEICMEHPEHFGKLIKEGMHFMYQKGTARNYYEPLMFNIK